VARSNTWEKNLNTLAANQGVLIDWRYGPQAGWLTFTPCLPRRIAK